MTIRRARGTALALRRAALLIGTSMLGHLAIAPAQASGECGPVPPGGGVVYEVVCDVAGEFPFVNHGFGHGQKGAIGILVVEG